MQELQKLINLLETKIPLFEKTNPSVSKSNVGWHIEHTLLTLSGIMDTIAKSNPDNYQWKFNFMRMVVLTLKKIPRGKAKAPEVVQPKVNYDIKSLKNHLEKVKATLETLPQLNARQYFNHPFFGKLQLKQTIKFLEIHTKHHLDIINEIVK